MNAAKINALAHRIMIDLFTNGADQQASRLVLEWDDGNRKHDLGGLCQGAVLDRVRDLITDAVIRDLKDQLHGEQPNEWGEG